MNRSPNRRRPWTATDRTGGLFDAVLDEVRHLVPTLVVERIAVTVFLLGDRSGYDLVQVDAHPGGHPPFLIDGAVTTSEVDEAVWFICGHLDADREALRRRALQAFMQADMPAPPARALMVSALAGARRSVAAHEARREPIRDWLESQIRLRGVAESAAFVAVLEIAGLRGEMAETYRRRYPDRLPLLDRLLQTLAD